MSDKLDIEKLFQDKFENFEADVSPDIWTNVSQNIGSSATGASGTAAKTGMSVWMKTALISGGILAASVAGVYLFTENEQSNTEKDQRKELSKTEVVENMGEENREPVIEVISESGVDSSIDNNKKEIEEELNELKDEVKEFDKDVSEKIVIKMDELKDEPLINLHELIDDIEVELDQSKKTDQVEENTQGGNEAEEQEIGSSEETKEEKNITHNSVSEEENLYVDNESSEEEQKQKTIVDNSVNVFTPDNDGVNDAWSVKTENVKNLFIQIKNRSGEIVFESNDKDFSWDGRDKRNEQVKDGAYMYIIVVTGNDGESVAKSGLVYVR